VFAHDDHGTQLLRWAIMDAKSPEEGLQRILKLVRVDPGATRIGEVRALAGLRALKDNPHLTTDEQKAEIELVESTFYAYKDPDGERRYVLSKVPAHRAPPWAQQLNHGDRRNKGATK
jgi:hypothetical protein